MATIRLMPPGDGSRNPITINGRTYTCALGATLDVPDFDAQPMEANGWHTSGATGATPVVATAARPAAPAKNQTVLDTTVGALIKWDGKAWRNNVTGAAV